MNTARKNRTKWLIIALAAVGLCLVVVLVFYIIKPEQQTATLADRLDAAAAAVQTFRDTPAGGEAYAAAIDTLAADLKEIYPDEFHENLDELDNSYAPVGGLTERQYAMSDIEWILDALRGETTDEGKNGYLGSLCNTICELEYATASDERAEMMSLLHTLETAEGSDQKEALSQLEAILQSRYAKPYATSQDSGEPAQTVEIDCVQQYRDAVAADETQKAAALEQLEGDMNALFATDPFLSLLTGNLEDAEGTAIRIPLIMQ